MAMEWERMVPECAAGQAAEFSTIMLVPESGRWKCGAGGLGLVSPAPPSGLVPDVLQRLRAGFWTGTDSQPHSYTVL